MGTPSLFSRSRRGVTREVPGDIGHWLAITPPIRMAATSADALAEMLVATVSQPRPRRGPRPRLALEVIRTAAGPAMAGVWVPGVGTDLGQVTRGVRKALPGAQITQADAGVTDSIRPGRHITGQELRPAAGPWSALTEPSARRTFADADTEEPLRLVLNAITGSSHWAALQVVITAGSTGNAALPSAPGPTGALIGLARRIGRVLPRLAKYVALMLMEALKALAEIITVPVTTTSTTSQVRSHSWRREDAKRDEPHVHVTVRVATTEDNPDHTTLPDEVAAAYHPALHLAALTPSRARPGFPDAWANRERGRGFYATPSELAALWHLPLEPSDFHMAVLIPELTIDDVLLPEQDPE